MSYVFYNSLEIVGNANEIEKVLEAIKGGENELGEKLIFDFQKIIPMPEDMRNEYFHMLKGDQVTKIDYSDWEKLDNRYRIIGQYLEWCYDNWGCKFDPWNEEIFEGAIIKFQTVNGRALPVIKELSRQFPTVKLVYESLCETPDFDYVYSIQGGEVIDLSKCEHYGSFDK